MVMTLIVMICSVSTCFASSNNLEKEKDFTINSNLEVKGENLSLSSNKNNNLYPVEVNPFWNKHIQTFNLTF